MANYKCKECGCACTKCLANDHDVHLHVEIENLKQRLMERDNHILSMETNFLNEANKFPNGEIVALREELLTWQDKYKRLYEAHRRVQRVNQGLEDKLLKLVDVCETDKNTLTKDVATLSHKLADANYSIKKLTDDNERYKNDVAVAIQFLQCKRGNFVSQKVDSLPNEVQAQVSSYMANKRKPEEKKPLPEMKSIKVPIPTFPPTAMVYSIPKSPSSAKKLDPDPDTSPVDIVSAAIMAKVLEERERERSNVKHCDTCTCSRNLKIVHHNAHHTVSTQTGEYKNSTCLRCNAPVEQNSTGVKVVKLGESIKHKNVPIYVHDYHANDLINLNQNIAKVQPNNFLTDRKIKVADLLNLDGNDNTVDLTQIRCFDQSTKFQDLDEKIHHRLCDKTSRVFEIATQLSLSNAEDANADALKGPRYCSMRLQTGSKNILLDNAHNNVAPILYRKNEPIESISSGDYKNSTVSHTSFHNQRVAEWIENNMDLSTSDNSRSDSLKSLRNDVDRVKYVEMENNVKRFLFGESEFLKTVEVGKRKYKSFRDNEPVDQTSKTSRSSSHTETEI